MTLAYFAMLVVMIYDTGLFLALISGFGLGYACIKSDKNLGIKSAALIPASWHFEDTDSLTVLSVEGMMCMQKCGNTVQMVLKSVPGVEKVHIGLSEKCAYISGTASTKLLMESIEKAGFDATVVRAPKSAGASLIYGSSI